MAAVACDEMELDAALIVTDAAQRLLLDLKLIAQILGNEFECGARALINAAQRVEKGLVSIGCNRACLHRGPPRYSMHGAIQKELQNIDGIDIDRYVDVPLATEHDRFDGAAQRHAMRRSQQDLIAIDAFD